MNFCIHSLLCGSCWATHMYAARTYFFQLFSARFVTCVRFPIKLNTHVPFRIYPTSSEVPQNLMMINITYIKWSAKTDTVSNRRYFPHSVRAWNVNRESAHSVVLLIIHSCFQHCRKLIDSAWVLSKIAFKMSVTIWGNLTGTIQVPCPSAWREPTHNSCLLFLWTILRSQTFLEWTFL